MFVRQALARGSSKEFVADLIANVTAKVDAQRAADAKRKSAELVESAGTNASNSNEKNANNKENKEVSSENQGGKKEKKVWLSEAEYRKKKREEKEANKKGDWLPEGAFII